MVDLLSNYGVLVLCISAGVTCGLEFFGNLCPTNCSSGAQAPCKVSYHSGEWPSDPCPFFPARADGAVAAQNFTYTISYDYVITRNKCAPKITLKWTYPPVTGTFHGFILTILTPTDPSLQECAYFEASLSDQLQEFEFACINDNLELDLSFILAAQPPRTDKGHEVSLGIDTRKLFFPSESKDCSTVTVTQPPSGDDMDTDLPSDGSTSSPLSVGLALGIVGLVVALVSTACLIVFICRPGRSKSNKYDVHQIQDEEVMSADKRDSEPSASFYNVSEPSIDLSLAFKENNLRNQWDSGFSSGPTDSCFPSEYQKYYC